MQHKFSAAACYKMLLFSYIHPNHLQLLFAFCRRDEYVLRRHCITFIIAAAFNKACAVFCQSKTSFIRFLYLHNSPLFNTWPNNPFYSITSHRNAAFISEKLSLRGKLLGSLFLPRSSNIGSRSRPYRQYF